MSFKLSDVSIDRPVFTSMLAVAVLVLGGLALTRLGVDLFPNVTFPIVTITTPYPGASPEVVEAEVSRPIEEAVSSLSGVDEVRSESRDSLSVVVISFDLEADVRQATNDVRDKVATIRGTLPDDIADPIISRIDPTAIAVLTYAVSSSRDSIETRQIVDDEIRPVIEQVDGVGSVTVSGGAVREVRVELVRAQLEAQGLTVAQVAQAIGAESFDLPGGRLTEGTREVGLTAAGRFRTPSEVGEVVLRSSPNGTQIRVRDVAEVVDGVEETRTLTRVDGAEAVTFQVQKQAGTNTIAVADGVAEALAALVRRLPPDVHITKVIDASEYIRTNMSELERTLVIGGVLAVVVIFLFMLDWRSTLISAIALPTSVIASFFVMWQLGFTLNMMTMMGLSLAIGMLIDDSVVVRENIFRHMERGEDPLTAARRGTSEIALAVMATTFTIVAVFVPVAFTGGMVGQMLREFGLTVTAAVLVSLLVSFTLDPMLSARIVQKIAPDHHDRMRRHRVFGPIVRGYDALDALYRSALAWTLQHRLTVVAAAALIFVGSLSLTSLMGLEFMGRGDRGELSVNIELPAGTSLAETDRVTRQVEGILREMPELVSMSTEVGPDEEVQKATIRVQLTPKTERDRSMGDVMEWLRPRLAAIPGLTYNLREARLSSSSSEAAMESAPIVLKVQGDDYAELGRIAQQAYGVLQGIRGVRDLSISYRPGQPEERLVLDRTRAGDLGVSFATVATTLRTGVVGDVVASYRDGDHDRDVRVQLREADRDSLDEIEALQVPSRTGRLVALRDVTRREEAAMPASISRLDRERCVTITANLSGVSLGDAIAEMQPRLDAIRRPAGYTFRFAGEAENMSETFTDLGLALALAIVFIYLVLASQFESLLHPLTIMFSLPLAIVGALVALFLAGQPLGMAAMIGFILLMGLVTKNAILLVDFTNQLRDRGRSMKEALLEAGPTRLRPILMTSAAMVLGMLPSAIGRGEGSEFRAPMAIAVVGGVIVSTLLTLVVVPVVYTWVDRFTVRGRRERAAAREKAANAGVAERDRSGASLVPEPARVVVEPEGASS
jgi:hydrophobic/amphiphilic exporter-1 (mainly G- bacteria), HAE1 family